MKTRMTKRLRCDLKYLVRTKIIRIVTPELIERIKADQTARTTAEGFGT